MYFNVMCVALFTLNMTGTRRKSSVIFSHLWKSFLMFFLFFLQSVNKVTIAACAKTVGKIVFIKKMKILSLLHIYLFIFSKQSHWNWFWQWRRVKSSSISFICRYRGYIIFWYGRRQIFLSLYHKGKRKCQGFYGWMNQCKQLIQFQIISTEYLCTR